MTSLDAMVEHSFIDTISKNGNLLLNVGPRGEEASAESGPEGLRIRLRTPLPRDSPAHALRVSPAPTV